MKNTIKTFYVIFLTAVFLTTCTFEFDIRPETVPPAFVPVENITGIRTGSFTNIFIPLSGTVMPQNATHKKIEWSITNDGGTGSTLEGNRLTADNGGTVTVTALIRNGLGKNEDYTQDFEIEIVITSTVPVEWISGIPATLTMGTYTLHGTVKPSNVLNTTILWNVKSAGTTGASIYGNELTTTSSGTVVITAIIENGLLDSDYMQDFEITVYRPVYASGAYTMGWPDPYKACYWIDKERIDLDRTGVPADELSYTTGIVFVGNKMYISGGYGGDDYGWFSDATTACYWVVDETTGPGGTLHILDSITSLGGDAIETMSIAVDGTTVYITGRGIPSFNTYSYYFWKIQENGYVEQVELKTVKSQDVLVQPDLYNNFKGCIAAVGGKVYIPFSSGIPPYGNSPYTAYYWDEDGNYHKIAENYIATRVAIINGSVCFAGFLQYGTGWNNRKLSYLILGNEPVSFAKYDDENGLDFDGKIVMSIIEQNGKIWFYGFSGTSSSGGPPFRFDTEGYQEYLNADINYAYNTGVVHYSDGDVYIALDDGYMVIGKYLRILGGENFGLPDYIEITGIAIR